MRRLALTATVLVATCCSYLAVGASPAHAYTGYNPLTDPKNTTIVDNWLRDLDHPPAPASAYTQAETITGWDAAYEAAGTFPDLLTAAAPIVTGTVGLYTGWKIGTPLGNWLYTKIVGDTTVGPTIPALYWTPSKCGTSTSKTDWNGGNSLIQGTGTVQSCTVGGSAILAEGFSLVLNSVDTFCAASTTHCSGNSLAEGGHAITITGANATEAAGTVKACPSTAQIAPCTLVYTSGSTGTTRCSTDGTSVAAGACFVVLRSRAAMLSAVQIQPSTSTEYAGATNTNNTSYSSPSTVNDNAGAETCVGNNACNASGNCALDPTSTYCSDSGTHATGPWAPIYLPQPLPGETVPQYIERLRARTWLGGITLLEDPMSYPSGSPAMQLNPQQITKLQVGTTAATLYDPLTGEPRTWPTTPPQLKYADTDLTITEVPDTFVPEGGGGGGLHFPTVSFGCQFPFGFICWAQDITGWFNVSPAAPDFDFTIPDQTVAGHTFHVGSHYDVNLNVMDSYMSVWRTILSVVIWIGGLYYLAVKLLGFHPGGDPGEALDDGLDLDGGGV